MITVMIFIIQLQKVAEISEAVMRKMGRDLVEKPTLATNHIQRLGGCMAYSKQCSIRNVSTSLLVSHHLSSCYYSLQVLMFSFIFWGRESNELKVWVLIVRFKLT